MRRLLSPIALCLLLLAASPAKAGGAAIRMPSGAALSPDGKRLAFSWKGDLWIAAGKGGGAHRITRDRGYDRDPFFSPDGRSIAFTSNRSGSWQIYLLSLGGGRPRRITSHSEGYTLQGWAPDGKSLLALSRRDDFWRHSERFFLVKADGSGERKLFNAYGHSGQLSPDGKRLLFVREGVAWWRRGYQGSQASQVWLYELETKRFTRLLSPKTGARWPLWRPDGQGFYYCGAPDGLFNLYEYELAGGASRRLTNFRDEPITAPAISADGRAIVYRHLFDLARLALPSKKASAVKLHDSGELPKESPVRRLLRQASAVAYSPDGLEIAFIAGGDLWVMDTELREPRQLTNSPEEEREPLFSPDGKRLLFISDQGGQPDIWEARREDETQFWWQPGELYIRRLTDSPEEERQLDFSPEGSRLAYVVGRGDLWTMGAKGGEHRRVMQSWNAPSFDWSPDGRWFVYSRSDDDFNRDIWIRRSDGTGKAFNLSRHPDDDGEPVWSPDGRMIAFTGRRSDKEIDISYVWLRRKDHERSERERRMARAIGLMKRSRKGSSPGAKSGGRGSAPKKPSKPMKKKRPEKPRKKSTPELVIDFDDIHERLRKISIPNSIEQGLVWSPDSKRLVFQATIGGRGGLYSVSFGGGKVQPKFLSGSAPIAARWLPKTRRIVGLLKGLPASLSERGALKLYAFTARQEFAPSGRRRAAFDLAWRAMRDSYYDPALGNNNWDAVGRKYRKMAELAPHPLVFEAIVNMMLGELNGSHLGFRLNNRGSRPNDDQWLVETAHLGLRFDPSYKGPGLRVRDVLRGSPASREASAVKPGELVLSIDGQRVDPSLNLAALLTGATQRDIRLRIRDPKGRERNLSLRPSSFRIARARLYEGWMRTNRARVDKLSGGRLGYLHIRGMNWPSFLRFVRELYAVGAGKDGIVIDVRENGGGFTTDHLLTILTQPRHAITKPRGGGRGYPQGRMVYASWHKPIIVLCNQNSFSNAEIFSHAIKSLGRGHLVGVQTAGGVISTGRRLIMDIGTLRLPFRGWYVEKTGEDMELNGALPDVLIWPEPGELPAGKDRQLDAATRLLIKDVAAWKKRPRPRLRKASARAGG